MDESIVNDLQLIKPGENSKDRVFTAQSANFSDLPVGGNEGAKHRLSLKTRRTAEGGETPVHILNLVSKEVRPDKRAGRSALENAAAISTDYQTLRQMGYPVPSTVRYFQKDEVVYIAMTDMKENGKYQLWGLNDRPTANESDELLKMDLDQGDLDSVKQQVEMLKQKATADSIPLYAFNFHARKDTETGKVDIVLLDIQPQQLQTDPRGGYEHNNQFHSDRFMNKLQGAISRARWDKKNE